MGRPEWANCRGASSELRAFYDGVVEVAHIRFLAEERESGKGIVTKRFQSVVSVIRGRYGTMTGTKYSRTEMEG